jgi:hypothetical protein
MEDVSEPLKCVSGLSCVALAETRFVSNRKVHISEATILYSVLPSQYSRVLLLCILKADMAANSKYT